MRLYKQSLSVFLRDRKLSIPYYAVLALVLAMSVYCLGSYSRYGDVFSAVRRWLARPVIFIIAFFIYCGYELTVRMHDNNMVEYVRAHTLGLLKAYSAVLFSLLTIVAVPSSMFFAFFLFLYHRVGVQYAPFLVHLIKLSVLYFGLSLAAGAMLGMAMAARLRSNRLAVYTLTTGFMLLNTTFTDAPFRVPYLVFNSYLVERALYYIKDFLTLVPHQLGSYFDIYPIYGFPMEPVRWVVAVFWVLFPLTLVLVECFTRRTRRALLVASALLLLLGVGLFSVRGSVLAMDMRNDSYPYADPIYYMDRPRQDYAGYEAGFAIEAYRMDLTVSNELHAQVQVTVDNPGREGYEFTLYHGYILKSVRTEGGEIPFTREGDYVSIGGLNGSDTLVFTYHGKSPKFYANAQAITLPGYFTYYPKAGRSNIWDLDRYGYVVNLPPYESVYTVKVRSGLEVFCNLAGGDNGFHGRSNGVSLFAGMYDEVAHGIYAEPMRSGQRTRESILEAEQILTDAFLRVGHPEMVIALSDRKFFQAPASFALNSNTDNTVIMSDHIVSSSSAGAQGLAPSIMTSIVRPKSSGDFRFRRDYLSYLLRGQDETSQAAQSEVDTSLLLREMEEWLLLPDPRASLHDNMTEQEREAFATAERQWRELERAVSEKAATYLFCQSTRKQENLRLFFDYFTSESTDDCLPLAIARVREELGP